MRFGILALQVVSGHMRVDLRGGEALVPKQFTYGLQVRTSIQKVRGETVTQDMRRALAAIADRPKEVVDDGIHTSTRKSTAAVVQKNSFSILDGKTIVKNFSV